MPNYTVIQNGPNVLTVKMQVTGMADWEQWFLLRSDAHHDNPHCDQNLERRHLDLAKQRGAGVIDLGDLFCAMQGKWDKRSSKDSIREEHQGGNYLDALVNTAAGFYGSYADNLILFGQGNHETAIKKQHETDLTQRLVAALNSAYKAKCYAGGYTNWVRFCFERVNERHSRVLWGTHGYGGGGPVTMDTIQANRQQVYVENADIMLSGHTHDQWHVTKIRLKLNRSGKIERRPVHLLKLGTYKDEYGDGTGGFPIEKGHPPKPLGAWWCRFYWDGDRGLREQIIQAD